MQPSGRGAANFGYSTTLARRQDSALPEVFYIAVQSSMIVILSLASNFV